MTAEQPTDARPSPSDPTHGTQVVDELAGEMGGVDTLALRSRTGTATRLLDMDYADRQRP